MKATPAIKEVFSEFETKVLNISDYGLTDAHNEITHVVLDKKELLLFSANPDLGDNFQDEDYEQILINDNDKLWKEIKEAIIDL